GAGDLHGASGFPNGLRGEQRKAGPPLRRGRDRGRSVMQLSARDLDAFFGADHLALADRLERGPLDPLQGDHHAQPVMRALGALGLLAYLVPEARGGANAGKPDDARYIDVRSLVTIREALGQVAPLADAVFAVQGLGSYPIVLAGTTAQRAK